MGQRTPVIALVEDNPADAMMLRYALGKTDVTVQVVVLEDGKQAVDFLCHPDRVGPSCDLVIMDLNLPVISGFEVLAKIKSDAGLKKLPVIILSSSASPKDVERCYREGANAYICKPTDLAEILSTASSIVKFWLGSVMLPGAAVPVAACKQGG